MALPASRRVGGTASLTIDGDSWDASDIEYSPSGVLRETQKGQTGVVGFSVMPREGFISAKLRDRSDKTVLGLNGKEFSTIIAVLSNGKTVYAVGAWQVGEIGVATQDGTFPVKFESDSVTESTV